MFQSFTGSSRRPRQVNLSGRNANPFAAADASSGGPQHAIQTAHQDRQHRQQQRQQLNAAKVVQRTWRGHASRRKTKELWRQQWDAAEANATDTTRYQSPAESLARLHMLMLFFSSRNRLDIERLIRYANRQKETLAQQSLHLDASWRQAYLRLETSCLNALSTFSPQERDASADDALLRVLPLTLSQVPEAPGHDFHRYYTALSNRPPNTPSEALRDALHAPLRSGLLPAYQGFVESFLTKPHQVSLLHDLADSLDMSLFTQAASAVSTQLSMPSKSRLWLLGHYIYLIHDPMPSENAAVQFDIVPHIPTIATLLASLADDIAPEAAPVDMGSFAYDKNVLSTGGVRVPLNTFLHTQIQRLVDQRGIRSLLARPRSDPAVTALDSTSDNTQLLAGYALTLLRIFPSRADDIRMWLYLGPSGQAHTGTSIPAIAYFWRGARKTNMFDAVIRDPRATVNLLVPAQPSISSSWQPPNSRRDQQDRTASDWRVMIVFLELYTFVLKIMDDEEFLGGDTGISTRMTNNALPLSDIKDLTMFLKNLGFAMYYHAQEIANAFNPTAVTLTPASLARHFGAPSASADPEPEAKPPQQQAVAGIIGMSLDYLKTLVTGLLRAIYERDSRRQFLPKGHWLMTSRFDMSNFIQAVVGEEERRRQLESQDEEDGDDDSDSEASVWTLSHSGRAQNRHRHMERDQRRASRKRYLQVVAPRLEILQNMPFLIPFEVRVEVFREFVRLDQVGT